MIHHEDCVLGHPPSQYCRDRYSVTIEEEAFAAHQQDDEQDDDN